MKNTVVRSLFICLLFVSQLFAKQFEQNKITDFQNIDQYADWQEVKALYHLHKNISVIDAKFPGFVIASPDREPNYYFHWVRDAALVMSTLFHNLETNERIVFFDDYARIVHQHQSTSTNISGLGEVKYKPDGTAYTGPWGRPQNDGPALRVLALSKYFRYLKKQNLKSSLDDNYFYSSDSSKPAVIKKDLDYLLSNWKKKDYDLWEEVNGDHFFTKMVQAEAFLQGIKIAELLGDATNRDVYLQAYNKITSFLNQFYDLKGRYFRATINWVDGHNYKETMIDASSLVAFNQINHPFNVNSNNNFKKVVETFRNLYGINKSRNEYGIGRYPEDFYVGGNPWFLLTAAAGEYLYKMVVKLKRQYNISSSQFPLNFIPNYQIPQTKQFSKAQKDQLLANLFNYADEFLITIKNHVDLRNGQIDEQYHKNSGYMLSAKHLTWSYAAFLSMKNARDRAKVALNSK